VEIDDAVLAIDDHGRRRELIEQQALRELGDAEPRRGPRRREVPALLLDAEIGETEFDGSMTRLPDAPEESKSLVDGLKEVLRAGDGLACA
jgi:hypothetical protein